MSWANRKTLKYCIEIAVSLLVLAAVLFLGSNPDPVLSRSEVLYSEFIDGCVILFLLWKIWRVRNLSKKLDRFAPL
jgi:hypothetical protein